MEDPIIEPLKVDAQELQESLRELLQQNLAVAQENNVILKRMVKIGRIAFWIKVLIWTVVLILPLILIPYILPYFKSFSAFGISGNGGGTTLFGFPSPTEVQHALQAYKGQQ